MELNEFIKRFCEELEIDNAEELNGDTDFRQLDEWSSLAGLTIMGLCDDEYGVTLDATEMRGAETLQDLFDLVNSKK